MAAKAPLLSLSDFQIGATEGRPLVYLDIGIDDEPLRRVRIELFSKEMPYTCNNFRLLCTGERKGNARLQSLWYKMSRFHRIIPGFMMQGGDITHGNGIGGLSAQGKVFEDESFLYKHQLGSVSMAHQSSSNKSQFFFSFGDNSWLDGKHVVFGQVIADDLPHLKAFEAAGSSSGLPIRNVIVTNAGQLGGDGFNPNVQHSVLRH